MKRLRSYNKFFRRYEVDLWGRGGFQKENKTVRFLTKVQKEKILFYNNPGRSFRTKRFQKPIAYADHRKARRKSRKKLTLKSKTASRPDILPFPTDPNEIKKLFFSHIRYLRKKYVKYLANKKSEEQLSQKILPNINNINKNVNNKSTNNNINKNVNNKSINNNINKNVNKNVNNKKYNKSKKPATFLYRIDYADPQRKRAKTSLSRELFLVKTKLLKYYNNIKKRQIRRYANTKTFKIKFKAARGYTNRALLKYNSSNSLKKRLALNAFFSLVEHRVDVALFRSNLAMTMQQARQLINHRHVFVNNSIVTHCGFILKNFNVISLSKSAESRTKKRLLKYIQSKHITMYPPKYMCVDYRLFRVAVISNPMVKDVPFPFKIDLKKWLGLAKYMF